MGLCQISICETLSVVEMGNSVSLRKCHVHQNNLCGTYVLMCPNCYKLFNFLCVCTEKDILLREESKTIPQKVKVDEKK